MSDLLVLAGIGAASLVARAALDTVRPRLALARAVRGGRVRVPVRAARPGRTTPAVLVRRGDDVHVVGRGVHWVAQAAELGRCRNRGVVDTGAGVVGRGYELVDAHGSTRVAEVDHAWLEVLDVVAGSPAAPRARTAARPSAWAARPGLLAGVAVAFLLAATMAGTLLSLTTERTSPVVALAETDEGGVACRVEWVEGDRVFSGAPDCPETAVGEPLTYLTTPWPVEGNAWDPTLGTLMVLAPGLLGVTALTAALVVGGARSRRPAVRLTAGPDVARARADGPETALPSAPEAPAAPGGGSFDDFLDRAGDRLGWADEPAHRPDAPTSPWRADLGRAAATTPYGLVGGSLFLLGLAWLDEWAQPVVTGLLVVAALAALRSAWRLGALVHQLGETWAEPFTSEWRYRAARSPDGDWIVLLMLGSTPRWFVAVPGRPPLAGTALVRGDLSEGGSVHLELDGHLWLPVSGVVRVDEDWAREIREALTFEMTGRLDLGRRVDGHEAAPTG